MPVSRISSLPPIQSSLVERRSAASAIPMQRHHRVSEETKGQWPFFFNTPHRLPRAGQELRAEPGGGRRDDRSWSRQILPRHHRRTASSLRRDLRQTRAGRRRARPAQPGNEPIVIGASSGAGPAEEYAFVVRTPAQRERVSWLQLANEHIPSVLHGACSVPESASFPRAASTNRSVPATRSRRAAAGSGGASGDANERLPLLRDSAAPGRTTHPRDTAQPVRSSTLVFQFMVASLSLWSPGLSTDRRSPSILQAEDIQRKLNNLDHWIGVDPWKTPQR